MQWAKFCPGNNPFSQILDLSPIILCHKKNKAQIILAGLQEFQTTAKIVKVNCNFFKQNVHSLENVKKWKPKQLEGRIFSGQITSL